MPELVGTGGIFAAGTADGTENPAARTALLFFPRHFRAAIFAEVSRFTRLQALSLEEAATGAETGALGLTVESGLDSEFAFEDDFDAAFLPFESFT